MYRGGRSDHNIEYMRLDDELNGYTVKLKFPMYRILILKIEKPSNLAKLQFSFQI